MNQPVPVAVKTWFILGRESLLSAAEIIAVTKITPESILGSVLKLDQKINPDLINQLGGTIKIAEELGSNLNLDELQDLIIKTLKNKIGKIEFGLSWLEKENRQLGKNIKAELKNSGLSVRYVEGKNGVINAAQIKGNKLIDKGADFIIEKNGAKYNLAKTIAVQDVDEYSRRDFGRPGRDDLSGMLPPKLALMMINLSQAKKDEVLLDPFCGSGTILSEALLLGYKNLIGSDISAKAIADTQKNIDWILSPVTREGSPIHHSPLPSLLTDEVRGRQEGVATHQNIKLLNADVNNLSTQLGPNNINTIITEPYLGKPLRGTETETEILLQAQELKKLYLSAFSEFVKILKPKGRIIFIIPRFKYKNDWITIDIKDEIKALGFWVENLLPKQEAILYARPDQKVGREIWMFTLNK